MENALVLWTGGKDSCLAFHIAREHFNVAGLATFVPVGNAPFLAHPQSEMREQAERLGLKIHFLEVQEPYKKSYVERLKWAKSALGVTTAVTGDIDFVGGCANWIVDCCEEAKLEIFRPLWQKEREWVMAELLERGIKARINYISHGAIPSAWKGRVIDSQLIEDLKILCKNTGMDLAGENGEYHTMVVEAPCMASFGD